MRFRPLRIDYQAEAIQMLREQRQPRPPQRQHQQQQEDQQTTSDDNDNDDDNDESSSIVEEEEGMSSQYSSSIGNSRRRRRRRRHVHRRVIRIFQQQSEEEEEEKEGVDDNNNNSNNNNDDDDHRDDNLSAALAAALLWPSLVHDDPSQQQQVQKQSSVTTTDTINDNEDKQDKAITIAMEIDGTTTMNRNKSDIDIDIDDDDDDDDDDDCSMNDDIQQVSSPINNPKKKEKKKKKNDSTNVIILINYRLFYDSPWLLNLISSIRRRANRKRIANKPIECYQYKYHYRYYVYSEQYWSSNDSFSDLYRKMRQRYFDQVFFLRCSKASSRRLDTLMVYIKHQKLLQVILSQYGMTDVMYGSNIMMGNFSSIVGGTSSLGSKQKRCETLKRELGAIVVITSNKNYYSSDVGTKSNSNNQEEDIIISDLSSPKTTVAKTSPSPSPSCQYSSVENVGHIAKKQKMTPDDDNDNDNDTECVSVSSSCHQEVANTTRSSFSSPPYCNNGNISAAEENHRVRDDDEQVVDSTTTKYQEHQPKNQNDNQLQQYDTAKPRHSPRNDNDSSNRNEKKRTLLLGGEKDKFASPLKIPTSTRNQYGCDSTPHRGNTRKLGQIRETNNREEEEGAASDDSSIENGQTIEESEERQRIHVDGDEELSKDSSSIGSVRKRLKMSQYDDDGNKHTWEGQSPSLMVQPSPKEPKHQKEKKKELTLLERFGLQNNDGEDDIHTPPSRSQQQTVVGRVSASNKKGNRYDDHNDISQSLGNNSAAFEIDSSPEEFPVCSYDHEEDSEADNSPKREAGVNASTKATKKEKKKRKRKRSKEERKRQKKEKKEEKRQKKQHKRICNNTAVTGQLFETKTSSVAIIGDDDKLETPRKLEIKDVSPVKEKKKTDRMSKLIAKANTIIDEGNFSGEAAFINNVPQNKSKNVVANDNTFNDPFSLSQGTATIEVTGKTSATANGIAFNDPFSVSEETIHANTDNDINGVTTAVAIDTTLDSSYDDRQHNAPIRLLCSEFFLENYGEVIAELVRGSLDGEGTTKSIQFTDTNLVDACGVDIETTGRGAIVVSSVSDIQKSGGLTHFLPRILELAATTRYHQLEIFICIDVELDTAVTQDLGRLQTALLCGGNVTKTRTTFKLSTKRSLASCIAKTFFSSTSSTTSSSGDTSDYSLPKVDHWLTDNRACRRLQFLLSVIPTLSVTGALHWLEMVQEDVSQQQVNVQTTDEDDDKSMRWIQKCFRNADDESKRLDSFLQQSKQHDINPNVAMQLMMVAAVGLNGQCWS